MNKLKQYFDSQGIKQVDICNILGKSKAQISNYLTGKVSFGKKAAKEWSNAFGLSESWLLTGEGSMILGEEAKSSSNQEGLRHGRFVRVTTHYTQEEENVNYINIDNITSFLLKEGSILINTSDGKRHKVTDNVSELFEALL